MFGLAHVEVLFGDVDAAAEAARTALASTARIAARPHLAHFESTKQALGEKRFTTTFDAVRYLSKEDARRYALGGKMPVVVNEIPLTARETDVAELVAEGRRTGTSRIGCSSPRTADTHVQRILTKLNFTGRAQVAAWITAERTG
ncbi:response regulator transcription factor [Saccharopolyspora taberi]|uniref:response regulator transcription factor n=1 Tax=Saccharopolyspora taberi TaxID=60895 RepID=UPI0031DDDE39